MDWLNGVYSNGVAVYRDDVQIGTRQWVTYDIVTCACGIVHDTGLLTPYVEYAPSELLVECKCGMRHTFIRGMEYEPPQGVTLIDTDSEPF